MNAIGDRRSTVVLVVLTGLAAAGVVIDSLGLASWLLIASVAAIVTFLTAQRVAWIPAFAAAIVLLLTADTVFVRVLQPIVAGLALKNRVVLAALAIVGLVLLWGLRRRLRLVDVHSIRPLLVALAPVVLLLVGATVATAASAGTRVGWAMQNDAVWNTMMARFLWADGGAAPGHPNVSPLVQALLAGAFAPGREAIAPGDLLQHDVTRQAELWLLMLLATSALAALVAWRGLSALRPVPRALFALLVSLIPLSWYAAGYAFQFGFFNATVSLIALLCAWVGWTAAREDRLTSAVILAASTIVLLATWAPLAIVTILLGVGVLAGGRRDWWRGIRRGRLAVLVLSLASIPVYLLGVTLPDVLREARGLAANGGVIAIEPRHLVVVGTVALASTALQACTGRRDRAPLIGVLLVGGATVIAIVYLALQRAGQDSWWGYYPQKLAWLVATLLIIVVAVAMGGSAPARAGVRRVLYGLTAVVVIPLMYIPLPTPGSVEILASALLPAPQVVSDWALARLFESSDPERLTVFARYGSPGEDGFANNWLIQQYAVSGEDPVRSFAYTLDGTDPAVLCALAGTDRVNLVVRTMDAGLAAQLRVACPAAIVTVQIG